MANTSKVFGAKLLGTTRGGPHTARVRMYVIPASDGTDTFLGDFVKSGGSADSVTGIPTVIQAAATDVLRGVVVGVNPIKGVAIGSENLNRNYRKASTKMFVMVCDDPDAIFEIQEDAVGAPTALNDVGENADIVVGSGNTGTGLSGMQLDSSTHVTTSAQLRILGFVERPDNTPASANAKLLVKINKHELASTSGV
jgi:hypothetical protein